MLLRMRDGGCAASKEAECPPQDAASHYERGLPPAKQAQAPSAAVAAAPPGAPSSPAVAPLPRTPPSSTVPLPSTVPPSSAAPPPSATPRVPTATSPSDLGDAVVAEVSHLVRAASRVLTTFVGAPARTEAASPAAPLPEATRRLLTVLDDRLIEEMGHYVEVKAGGGKRGVITFDDKSDNPYKVTFADGSVSNYLEPDELTSSGLGETKVLARAVAACAADVRAACDQKQKLSDGMREAVRTVHERVTRDELPLLSLLQAEPLQMQTSHLSFQEYFAARALCEEGTALSGAPLWHWPARSSWARRWASRSRAACYAPPASRATGATCRRSSAALGQRCCAWSCFSDCPVGHM